MSVDQKSFQDALKIAKLLNEFTSFVNDTFQGYQLDGLEDRIGDPQDFLQDCMALWVAALLAKAEGNK